VYYFALSSAFVYIKNISEITFVSLKFTNLGLNHRVCSKSNTMGVTTGAGNLCSSGAPEFTPCFLCDSVSHNVVSSTPRLGGFRTHNVSDDSIAEG
jgi:hypothetical protein